MTRRIVLGSTAYCLATLLCGCTIQGTPNLPTTVRQVDDNGVQLPFTTGFPNRWSNANNGTPYEPCNGPTSAELTEIGFDPKSVTDAAGTDGQTARGCRWTSIPDNTDDSWSSTQVVGNSLGIADEKKKRSGPSDVWLDDIRINGRSVSRHTYTRGTYCSTYVESRNAVVVTAVRSSGSLSSPTVICERAIAFTKATIGRMPE